MIKVGIVGGTGYTGVELLRLLAQHPQVKLMAITSRKETGMPLSLREVIAMSFTCGCWASSRSSSTPV